MKNGRLFLCPKNVVIRVEKPLFSSLYSAFCGSHAVSGQKMTGSIRFSQLLKAGDRVVLCSDDDQVFYILCKVVSQ